MGRTYHADCQYGFMVGMDFRHLALALSLGYIVAAPAGVNASETRLPDDPAPSVVLSVFYGTTWSPDGAIGWSGPNIRLIGIKELKPVEWMLHYRDSHPLRVMRAYARHAGGRLGRFDMATFQEEKRISPWQVIDWEDLSLHDAEEGVRSLLGESIFQAAFGRYDTDNDDSLPPQQGYQP